jgi:uncharacterized membrane protein YphA (DoxX/SURF4 family)
MVSAYTSNDVFALFLIRAIAGALFFFQGYDKIFHIKIPNVVHAFENPYPTGFRIPTWLLKPAVLLSSWIEFIGGALLFLGLFRDPVLYAIGADLLFVAIAFSVLKPMWDMQFFFPRLVLILLLLMLPEADMLSLDYLLGIRL